MTELLEKAFREAARLLPKEQDALASLLLAELESGRRYEEMFDGSQDALAELGDQALRDDDAGRTEKLVPVRSKRELWGVQSQYPQSSRESQSRLVQASMMRVPRCTTTQAVIRMVKGLAGQRGPHLPWWSRRTGTGSSARRRPQQSP